MRNREPFSEESVWWRVSEYVTKPSGCWDWKATKTSDGYGTFTHRGKRLKAHRFFYERIVGKIPPGLHLDHLCKNRACVNPDHLEAVTCRTNVLRGEGPSALNARKTRCVNGHILEGDNLYFPPGRKRRICVQCSRERKKRLRLKK